MTMASQFLDMTSLSNLFDVILFPLSSLVTGSSFMSVSLLVLELWQFSFIRVHQKSRNRKYSPVSFAQYLETGVWVRGTKFGTWECWGGRVDKITPAPRWGLKYLIFCPYFFDHARKWLHKKAKINSKVRNQNWASPWIKSLNWSHIIAWLPLFLEILGNMSIVIIYCPVCDVINFEINLNFLIKSFSYMTKKWEQKMQIPREEK